MIVNLISKLKYAQKFETWTDVINRNMAMHLNKFPNLKSQIISAYQHVYDGNILPSMRSLQYGGREIEKNNNKMYNCAYTAASVASFGEIMFLLKGGTGVGFSVENKYINLFPDLVKTSQKRQKKIFVQNSTEDYIDALNSLFFEEIYGNNKINFVYSPKNDEFKTCIENIRRISATCTSRKLRSIDIHDIICSIAQVCVDRAALISLFDYGDAAMMSAKTGNWWTSNPQRTQSNNSVILHREKIKRENFFNLWNIIKKNNSGEPGFFWTNGGSMGCNPCAEISLKNCQFCNLVEINATSITSQYQFDELARAAAFIATLQASFTDFKGLREEWKFNTEEEALIGVSLTGLGANNLTLFDVKQAAYEVVKENRRVAKLININPSARSTTIKPAGTTSQIFGCSSGIHSYHSDYYIRRIRMGKQLEMAKFLKKNHPELVEDDEYNSNYNIVKIPLKAPHGAITREKETALDLLNRIKFYYSNWILPGHVSGINTNNISATISIKPNEYDAVGEWLWTNKNYYNGLTILPHDDIGYNQAPFTKCTLEEYNYYSTLTSMINNDEFEKIENNSTFATEMACSANGCEF